MSTRSLFIIWGLLLLSFILMPLFITSNRWIGFLEMTFFVAVMGQSWNILGGYGGQYSFGHALFFGTAAYIQAIMQQKFGWSPWIAMWFAVAGTVLVASFVGYLSFRYGLKGSYFALITLAFAEAFHVLARSLDSITEGGRGIQLLLNQDPDKAISAFQFNFAGPFLSSYGFYYTILIAMVLVFAVTWLVEHSRFGAQLVAVRENEEAAEALGINTFRTKMGAILLSAAITSFAGIYYVQKYLFVEPGIAYGLSKSVEALFAPIIGGLGTVIGPLLGSFFIHGVGEITKDFIRHYVGDRPGVDLILFGVILLLVLAHMPRGLAGLLSDVWKRVAGGRNA